MIDPGFSPKQFEQLKQLFAVEFDHQNKRLELRFHEERKYYTQLIQQALMSIKQDMKRLEAKIDQLTTTESEDVTAVAGDFTALQKRVRKLERAVKDLQAA